MVEEGWTGAPGCEIDFFCNPLHGNSGGDGSNLQGTLSEICVCGRSRRACLAGLFFNPVSHISVCDWQEKKMTVILPDPFSQF